MPRTSHAPYIKSTLGPGEVIVRTASMHWMYYFWPAIMALGMIAFAIATGSRIIIPQQPEDIDTMTFFWILAVINLLWFAVKYLNVISTEFAVTNQRLAIKEGILSRTTDEVKLGSIESININQSILGRIFGFGDLVVTGTGNTRMTLKSIESPIDFRQAAMQQH